MAELAFDSTIPCAGLAGGDSGAGGNVPHPGGGRGGRGRGRPHAGGELVLSFLGEMCAADPVFASLLLQLVDDSKRSLGRKKKDGSGGGSQVRGWGTARVGAGDDGAATATAAAAAAAAHTERLLAVRRNKNMKACLFAVRCVFFVALLASALRGGSWCCDLWCLGLPRLACMLLMLVLRAVAGLFSNHSFETSA